MEAQPGKRCCCVVVDGVVVVVVVVDAVAAVGAAVVIEPVLESLMAAIAYPLTEGSAKRVPVGV